MSCITEVITLHEVRGRVRFKVPQIKWSTKNTEELKKVLRTMPGLYYFRTCAHVGTVIIYYNQKKLTKDEIIEAIHHCPYPESEEDKPKIPPELHIRKRATVGKNRLISGNSLILLDLLKHGVMAGGAGGGYVQLALMGLMTWHLLKKNGHKKNRRGMNGKRIVTAG